MIENEELTDRELSELLAAWVVPVPSQDLRARIFSQPQIIAGRSLFQTASKPQGPWYKAFARGSRSFGAAMFIQAAAIALTLLAVQTPVVQRKLHDVTPLIFTPPYQPKLPAAAQKAAGGGGGGMHDPKPVSRGEAPKFAPKTFIPPTLAIPHPQLPVVPTITAQAPQISDTQYGDPLAQLADQSGGPGRDGLGAGKRGGLGDGDGPGFGEGRGGSQNGGVYQPGGDVSRPILVSKVEPEYSEDARKAKYSGIVLLSLVVDVDGLPRNIHVVRSLGLGLDEKAVEAVQKWRFRPGLKGGRAVPTFAQVEVSFRLL